MSKSAKSTSLVGMFFHSVSKESGYIEWQGVVIGNPEPGWYLLQLFSWIQVVAWYASRTWRPGSFTRIPKR